MTKHIHIHVHKTKDGDLDRVESGIKSTERTLGDLKRAYGKGDFDLVGRYFVSLSDTCANLGEVAKRYSKTK